MDYQKAWERLYEELTDLIRQGQQTMSPMIVQSYMLLIEQVVKSEEQLAKERRISEFGVE